MAEPSKKSPEMESALNSLFKFDRIDYIKQNKCIPPPFGCGGDAKEFFDALSAKEYTISGMCQKCQNKIFGSGS